MNQLYIGIGLTLIVALLSALLAPLFIDWDLLKADFERQLSNAVGAPVHVRGSANAVILPTPSITFTDVVIGGNPRQPLLTARRFSAQMELFPLLSGDVQIVDMLLDKPILHIGLDADGKVISTQGVVSQLPRSSRKVKVDKFDIADGEIVVSDARTGEELRIESITATMTANSLAGPFKAEGSAQFGSHAGSFILSTGEKLPDSPGLRVKMRIEPDGHPLKIDLDGLLTRASDGRVSWKPNLRLDRPVIATDPKGTMPWLLEAKMEADTSHWRTKAFTFTYGPQDRPFTLSGAVDLQWGAAPKFSAVLSAKQIDLDRTLAAGPNSPVTPSAALKAFANLINSTPLPTIPGTLGFDIPGLVISGGIVQDLRMDASANPAKGWKIDTLEAKLPGHTAITLSGLIDVVPNVVFNGQMALSSSQPLGLLDWWNPQSTNPKIIALSLTTKIRATQSGVALDAMTLGIDQTSIIGKAGFLVAELDRPAQLDAALTADRLDLDQITKLWRLAGSDALKANLASADLRFALKTNRIDLSDVAASGIDVNIARTGNSLAITQASVQDLGGITLAASGQMDNLSTNPTGRFIASLKATKADGLRKIVSTWAADESWSDRLRYALPTMVPLDLALVFEARNAPSGTRYTVDLNGNLAQSHVSAITALEGTLEHWTNAQLQTNINLDGPESKILAALADLPASVGIQPGGIHLTASGTPSSKMQLDLSAVAGASHVTVQGQTSVTWPLKGDLKLSVNLPDVLTYTDTGLSSLTGTAETLPMNLSGVANLNDQSVRISSLSGQLGTSTVAADVTLNFAQSRPKATGSITFNSLPLGAITEVLLGTGSVYDPTTQSLDPWPRQPLGPMPLGSLDLNLTIGAQKVPLTATLAADAARFDLIASPGHIALKDVTATLAGGALKAQIQANRRDESTADITVDLATSKGDVATLWPYYAIKGAPWLSGAVDLNLSAAGQGRSIAGLISNLTGTGNLRVSDGSLRGLGPELFAKLIPSNDNAQPSTINEATLATLVKSQIGASGGILPFKSVDAPLTINAGAIKVNALGASGAPLQTDGTLTIDLASLKQNGTLTVSDPTPTHALAGQPPQLTFISSGGLWSPTVDVDTAALTENINLALYERENARAEDMQSEILERERLMRLVARRKDELLNRARPPAARADVVEPLPPLQINRPQPNSFLDTVNKALNSQ